MPVNSYNVYNEKEIEYLKNKNQALEAVRDTEKRRIAIHNYKAVTGSTVRYFFEMNGLCHGSFLNSEIIWKKIESINIGEEAKRFLQCLIDEYNTNEYKKRKIKIKKWRNDRTKRKHLKSYLHSFKKELKTYASLYISNDADKDKFKEMRVAILVFCTIIQTYYLRKMPLRISNVLYEDCVSCNINFEKFYQLCGDKACFIRGKKGYFNNYIDDLGDDVIWLFIVSFLHINN